MCIRTLRACELLLKIMAVLEKVGTLREQLPSILVDPCLYYCCTTHQALAALHSLCTEGCVRTARSTCMGICNVIREFIWTAAALLCAQIRTGFYMYDFYRVDYYLLSSLNISMHTHNSYVAHTHTHTHYTLHGTPCMGNTI